MEKRKFLYEALIYPSNVGFEVYFPDLDIHTQGQDLFDAAFMAQDLLELWVSDMLADGKKPPLPEFGHTVPEGGYAMVVAANCSDEVPEVLEMSVEDAAGILGVSRARVYAMVKDGVLDGRKVGRSVLVSTASVKERQNAPRGAGRPKREMVGV